MLRSSLYFLCLAGLLQAQVSTPQIGWARFADGAIRPVRGVAGSFVVGKPVIQHATAASFSEAGGVVAASGQVLLVDHNGSVKASCPAIGAAIPVVNIGSNQASAVAWLPVSQTIARWDPKGNNCLSTTLTAPIEGQITSIKLDGSRARALVARDGVVSEVTVALDSGNLVKDEVLPGIETPVLFAWGSMLFPGERVIEAFSAAGTRHQLVVASSGMQFECMGADWIHAFSNLRNQHWAWHRTAAGWAIFELPAPPSANGPSAAVLVRGEQ